jgi:toxin ParE1/3/4
MKKANQNLEQIQEYISQVNPSAGIDTVFKIIKSVEILLDHPAMGRPGRVMGTRELVVNGTPYIIPYRIKKEYVEVLRVLHAARQWPENL